MNSRLMSFRGATAAILLPVLSAWATLAGAATWDTDQDVAIKSSSFTQVLTYDFQTQNSGLSTVTFGDFRGTYILPEDHFVGAYLYDFTAQRFVNSFYATSDIL